MRYNYRAGVIVPFAQKFYKQLIVAFAAVFMASMALMTAITNAAPPNWTVNSGSTINFSCGGGNFEHVFDSVTQGAGGNFTGTGHYVPDGSYTWDATGNVSGDVLEFTITYTGTGAGSVYNLTNGVVAPDGSVSGDVDSNCESFTMPAGSLSEYSVTETEVDIYGSTTATNNDPGKWFFNRDVATSTPYEFNTDAASIGSGSLYVLPIENTPDADKFIGEYFAMTPISEVRSFSYDFQIGAGGVDTEEEQFYLNVYANFGVSPDDKFYDCRYNVVPTIGSTGGFTTVTFDPTQAYPVTTRTGAEASPFACPAVPADMDTLSAGSNIRAFAINLGDTSGSDLGLDGYFDNVVFATTDETTVFDFEPYPAVTNKEACKNDGWKLGLSFENQNAFKNQGDCVSYFATKQKNQPAGSTTTTSSARR